MRFLSIVDRGGEEFADQHGCGVLACLVGETLGERRDSTFGEIEFDPLDTMHGEEHDSGGEGLAIANLADEIVERSKIDAADAKAGGRKIKDRAPDLFARVGECSDDEGSGMEGRSRLGRLIKAGRGHDGIVVWVVGKMQTEGGGLRRSRPNNRRVGDKQV